MRMAASPTLSSNQVLVVPRVEAVAMSNETIEKALGTRDTNTLLNIHAHIIRTHGIAERCAYTIAGITFY